MRANELMIGDWVKSRGKIEQVTSVYDGYICTDSFEDSHDYYFDPIPLTPEILEKNGFEKKTFYGIYDDYFDLDIREYSDGLYIVTYHSCEFNIPDQTIHLSWVHELQNFMRHCGIDKEIVL